MHCQSDFLGTCTSNRHRDKSTAASKNLRPTNTTLNVLEGKSFTCSYALEAGPFGPAWAFLEFICHRDNDSTTSGKLGPIETKQNVCER